MNQKKYHFSAWLVLCVFLSAGSVISVATGFAAEAADMGGWGKNSPYNRLYNPAEMDRIKGDVEKITEVVPMPGMSPGVALVLREAKNETTLVHLCPSWYIDIKSTGLKKGDTVKIRGVWAEIDGKYVFMASKVKKGDYFELKIRLTKDGTPFWIMSPEEEAREKAGE